MEDRDEEVTYRFYTKTDNVLRDVLDERQRQYEKWGEQNHKNGTGPGQLNRLAQTDLIDVFSGPPSAKMVPCCSAEHGKRLCDAATNNGKLTWGHILFEEVCEAFEESDPVKLRAELVQVAAVAVAWIEAIDRARSVK